MFKKILIGFLILVVLLIGTVLAAPFLFKDDIIDAVKVAANDNLNATVDFGDFDLSILENFPDLTMSIHDVKVTGIDTFAGIELVSIGALSFTIDIQKAIGGEYQVKSVGLTKPNVHVKVLKDGTANWDIAKTTGAEDTPVEDEAGSSGGDSLKLSIEEYYIEEANIIYDDASLATYAKLDNFTHRGTAEIDVDAEHYLIHTLTTADAITVDFEGIKYLKKVNTEIKLDIDVDQANEKYTFKENTFRLNELELGLDGWLALVGDNMDMDLSFNAPQTAFGSILSLVPGAYTADFADVKTSGALTLEGAAKGTYTETSLPAFNLKLGVKDARFQYPDLPKSVEDIQIDLQIQNPGGSEDNTVIDLHEFHMELAENPIDLQLHTRTPISDPYIEAKLQTQMDLASLADVIPMEEGESYAGKITADLEAKGNQSAIDEERYQDFDARGQLILLDFDYKSPELPYETKINKAYLNFTPEDVELSSLNMNVGKSDIQASGRIENFIAYYLSDEPLKGTFDMTSNLMDLNEFMEEEEVAEGGEGAEGETEEEPLEVIEVPGNLDFVMSSKINKLLYDNMEMTNVNGGITVRDQKVSLDKLAMNMLGGELVVTGSYATVNPEKPEVDFFLDINTFDVENTFATFNTVQKLVPVGERADGAFSTSFSMSTLLDQNMEADLGTLGGNGSLKTHQVKLDNSSGAMEQVGSLLKTDQLKELWLDNVNINFRFEDGKLKVDPFDFKLGEDGDATMAGYHSFTGEMNYVMETEVPSGQFGDLANELVSGALSNLSILGDVGNVVPDRLKFNVLIGGTVTKPKVSLKPASEGSGSTNAATNVKEVIEDKIDDAKEKAEEEIEKQKAKARAELEARKKKILADAQKQADKVKAEAKKNAESARKAAYDQADKTEKDAGNNPLKKAGAKVAAKEIRKKGDQSAQKIIDEGDKRADQIMDAARKKADGLKP